MTSGPQMSVATALTVASLRAGLLGDAWRTIAAIDWMRATR